MEFKEFITLSEQMPPPPMTGGAGSGPPDVSGLLKELLPRGMMSKGRLQKAIGGGKTVLIVPNLRSRKKTQNLGAVAVKDINTDNDEINNATLDIMPVQKGSSSREYVVKKGKAREIMGKAVSDKKREIPIKKDIFNMAWSPHKLGGAGGPGGAPSANGMLPGPGMGMGG